MGYNELAYKVELGTENCLLSTDSNRLMGTSSSRIATNWPVLLFK